MNGRSRQAQFEHVATFSDAFQKIIFEITSISTAAQIDRFESWSLHPTFRAPIVIEKTNDVSFQLESSEPMKLREIHDAFLLKLYTEDLISREPQQERAVIFVDGHEDDVTEKSFSYRKNRGNLQYLKT